MISHGENFPSTTPYYNSKSFYTPKAHHISSIILCSVFGTGFLAKSALTLANWDSLPLLFGFVFMSFLDYQAISALCEMCTHIPLPNAYSGYTEIFDDPTLGYTIEYFYLFQHLIIGPNQVFVGAMTVQYWILSGSVSPAGWNTIFIGALSLLNYIDVAEIALIAHFFFSLKALVYISIMVIFLVVVSESNKIGKTIGFRYWSDPSAINDKKYNVLPAASDIVAMIVGVTNSIFPFVEV